MNKIKIRLDTGTDIAQFVAIANTISDPIYIEDGNGLIVNGKSLMGTMYGVTEFNELWIRSSYPELTSKFIDFTI